MNKSDSHKLLRSKLYWIQQDGSTLQLRFLRDVSLVFIADFIQSPVNKNRKEDWNGVHKDVWLQAIKEEQLYRKYMINLMLKNLVKKDLSKQNRKGQLISIKDYRSSKLRIDNSILNLII